MNGGLSSMARLRERHAKLRGDIRFACLQSLRGFSPGLDQKRRGRHNTWNAWQERRQGIGLIRIASGAL